MTCFNLLMDRLVWAWGGVAVLPPSSLINGLSIHNCARDVNKPAVYRTFRSYWGLMPVLYLTFSLPPVYLPIYVNDIIHEFFELLRCE